MSTEIYIRAASCISPQSTFGINALADEMKINSGKSFIAIEPDYKIHLNIPSARRMSRLIKMGVSAALSCLKDANVDIPGAIICGTGLGCMEDSEKFLSSLLVNNEQTLSPTSFIFSTHNTVAAQIALLLQCNNYNFTHTHRGLSFENSLLDAILFLNDNPATSVLAGAADEMTATSIKILDRLGVLRKEGSGIAAGEGAAFFTLKTSTDENNLAKLSAVSTFSNPEDQTEISERVADFTAKHNISHHDFILIGDNGDANGDQIYDTMRRNNFSGHRTGSYKHLCGEYHTSTAFACWMSALMLRTGKMPSYLGTKLSNANPGRILIFNHYKGREFSMMLLEKC